jgi:phage terminase large subunit-like protein
MIKKDDKIARERFLDKLDLIQKYNQVNLNESSVQKKARIERLKKNYEESFKYYFPHYANSECADFQIEAAEFIDKNPNCIDAEVWFRGGAKSVHMTIGVPFWQWTKGQVDVSLTIGKTADDAKVLLSDLQAEFESNPQIIADFGEQMNHGSWEEGQFVTKNQVAFFSLGRGQSPRGIRYRNKRPNYFVIDDIDDDEIADNQRRVKKVIKWLFGALYGAADNRGCRFIFANNLISNTGIIAHVVKHIQGLKRKNARVNMVPALKSNGEPSWPQKYTKEFFLERQQVMGDYYFQTEYQNNPQIEGKIFLDEQIQFIKIPKLSAFECIVGHWDVAYAGTETGDYNAVKIWGLYKERFYHIKAFVRQCKMVSAVRFMIEYEKKLPKDVRILWRFESQFWNDALKMTLDQVCKELKHDLLITQCERPVNNKFSRIVSMQPYFQNSRVLYNKEEEFDLDMQVGINQLKSIEPGYTTHDDGPDADEGALSFLSQFIPVNNPLPLLGDRHTSKSAW